MDLRPEAYVRYRNTETFEALEKFAQLAAHRGVDAATLATAWVLAQPQVTAVVVGPRRPEQLEPALQALDSPLTRQEAEDVVALF
jgi:aryl-alcohol dehydrogenase-like predicted oxidoreductase